MDVSVNDAHVKNINKYESDEFVCVYMCVRVVCSTSYVCALPTHW